MKTTKTAQPTTPTQEPAVTLDTTATKSTAKVSRKPSRSVTTLKPLKRALAQAKIDDAVASYNAVANIFATPITEPDSELPVDELHEMLAEPAQCLTDKVTPLSAPAPAPKIPAFPVPVKVVGDIIDNLTPILAWLAVVIVYYLTPKFIKGCRTLYNRTLKAYQGYRTWQKSGGWGRVRATITAIGQGSISLLEYYLM